MIGWHPKAGQTSGLPVWWAVVLNLAVSACSAQTNLSVIQQVAPGVASAPARLKLVRPSQYSGMGDASGAVPVATNFFVVANDEDNLLRLYSRGHPGRPLKTFNFDRFLGVRGKSLEADLEAAARIGDRAFWIGSHGRNRVGKLRTNRDRFFATDIKVVGGEINLVPIGQPYMALLDDLFEDARLDRFHLEEAALHAPKDEYGLNIEGLSATPDGHLLVGFRNPIPGGKALVIPLLNPNAVIRGSHGRFGEPILLDLGGLGIRDMALYQGVYIIIAGRNDSGNDFRLYHWAGDKTAPVEIRVKHLNRYHPEALLIYPDKGLNEMQILSDDGTLPVNGVPGKEVKNEFLKSFRSFWVVEEP